jgi:aminoglycoside phosphotransferase (APT) family kinase protein
VTLPVPRNAKDVTAVWLSQALSSPEAETRILSLTHEEIVPGAGTKLRVRVRYGQNPQQLPEVLWVKAGWEPHSPAMARIGIYVREAMFYDGLANRMGLRAPVCYAVVQDEEGLSAIIMEDLIGRGAELWTCTAPRSIEDIRALLDTLARLHACYWQSPELLHMPAIDVAIDAIGPTAAWPRENGGQRLRQVIEGLRGALMPPYARDADRIERAFWRMVETLDRTNGRCLLHGDPHPGNCFSDKDGGAGLYDWQSIARGPWAFDVTYAVTSGLGIADRRHAERDLLVHYLGALSALGVDPVPAFDEAWDDFRRYIAYALLIWPTNHVSHQPEDNIRAQTERLTAAAADFRMFELWGV